MIVIAWVVGILSLLAGLILAGGREALAGSVLIGSGVSFVIAVGGLGMILKALGIIALNTLDTAINTSPEFSEEDRKMVRGG